ncbi:MAG: ABC transporter permease [Gemmatimonadetes bacterium]|nr:ABC transporter permease [Gemmatimonadota bacterium]
MRLESIQEGARLAIDQLRANRFRSGLTILGIVVGVATVMAMSAMITGIRTTLFAEFEAAGPKNFFVARFNINDVRVFNGPDQGPPWGDNPPITEADAKAISQLPTIGTTIVGMDLSAEFTYGQSRLQSVPIAGREDGWTAFTRGGIIAGHDMLEADVRAASRVVLLLRDLAETLFGALDPIGRSVRINGVPFEVSGVFELSDNIFASLQKNLAIMPYTSAVKHLNAWDEMMGVFTVTSATATQDDAIDQVTTLLRTRRGLQPGDDNNFAVIRQEQLVETFNRVTGVFFLVMLALSSVALMVGGVGVIAIMMIAVTERTREIGIRKAIGATRREILWQFLFEAVTLTLIGSAIGMALGGGAAAAIASLTPVPAAVPFGAVVAALSMATVAGVVFGIWPALKASRLDPVEALRYE